MSKEKILKMLEAIKRNYQEKSEREKEYEEYLVGWNHGAEYVSQEVSEEIEILIELIKCTK